MNRAGRFPPPTGDPHRDAVRELRWAMGGAGLTLDKLPLMTSVLSLPLVRTALQDVAPEYLPQAGFDTVAGTARRLGDTLHARILRTALAVDYAGDGKDLTARRLEFTRRHNETARQRGDANEIGESMRTIYAAEQRMLDALVTALGVPDGGTATAHPAPVPAPGHGPAGPWATASQDFTCRMRGRAAAEVEIVYVLRALQDGLDRSWTSYYCATSTGRPTQFEMYEGGTVVDDQELGRPGFHKVTIGFPRPMAAGACHRLRYTIRYPRRRESDPWFTIGVVRPTGLSLVRVSFDPADVPRQIWLVDGIPSAACPGDPASSSPLGIDSLGSVESRFANPAVGWSYGVGWAW